MSPNLRFPTAPDQISADWLTARIRESGSLPETGTVFRFDSSPVDEQGTTSLVVRISLEYEGDPGRAPSALVAKFSSPLPEVKSIANNTGAVSREIRFYRQTMTRGQGFEAIAPRCYAAESDRASGDFVLLLEDLSDWSVGNVLGSSPDEVASLLAVTATFHARYWNDAELDSARWLARADGVRASAIQGLLAANLPACIERFGDRVGPQLRGVTELAINNPGLFELQGSGPQTLLHGDLHVQNAMFKGHAVRIIDWQSCFRGNPVVDVSRLLVSSLSAKDRQATTNEFVQQYCGALTNAGVAGYSAQDVIRDMPIGLLHSVMVYIVSMPNVDLEAQQERETSSGTSLLEATFDRLESALDDCDALAVLRELS